MTISEVGFTGAGATTTGSTGSIAYPAGIVANDKIVLVMVRNTSAAMVTPSGFSVLSAQVTVGSALSVAWYWKNATGAETGNLSLNFGGTGRWSAAMGVVRGAGNPVVTATSAGDNIANTTASYPGFTPPSAPSYAMAIGGQQYDVIPNTHTPSGVNWVKKIEADGTIATGANTGAIISGRVISSTSAVVANTPTNTQSARDIFYVVTFDESSNTVPTANAGPDQVDVEPLTTVTLDFSGSSDEDGTITTYSVTQTGGTAVTLSGSGNSRTFTAPATLAGTTLTFDLTVTDNSGALSTVDSVSVTVLPWDQWMRSGGAWIPRKSFKIRESGVWSG